MKAEVNQNVIFGILAAVVLFIGFLVWYGSENAYNRPGNEEARYREMERWAKQAKYDLRKDGLTAPFYYRYNPKEKPPPAGKEPEGQPVYLR